VLRGARRNDEIDVDRCSRETMNGHGQIIAHTASSVPDPSCAPMRASNSSRRSSMSPRRDGARRGGGSTTATRPSTGVRLDRAAWKPAGIRGGWRIRGLDRGSTFLRAGQLLADCLLAVHFVVCSPFCRIAVGKTPATDQTKAAERSLVRQVATAIMPQTEGSVGEPVPARSPDLREPVLRGTSARNTTLLCSPSSRSRRSRSSHCW
jgi:hypothetical protein